MGISLVILLILLECMCTASAYQPVVRSAAPRSRAVASLRPAAPRRSEPKFAKGAGLGTSAVVIKEDYSIAAALLVPGPLLMYSGAQGDAGATFFAGFLCTALGILAAQTMRVRFVLDKDDFRVMNAPLPAMWGADRGIELAGDNVVVGGANKGFVELGLPPLQESALLLQGDVDPAGRRERPGQAAIRRVAQPGRRSAGTSPLCAGHVRCQAAPAAARAQGGPTAGRVVSTE